MPRKCFDLMETTFCVKAVKWDNYHQNVFPPQNGTYTAKQNFWCFEAFLAKLTENFSYESTN